MKLPTKAQYPKSVKIGPFGIKYKIVFKDTTKWYGQCSAKDRAIYLSAHLTDDETFSAFIHEMLHAIEFESNTPVRHSTIYLFEEGLYHFFLNNLKVWGFK